MTKTQIEIDPRVKKIISDYIRLMHEITREASKRVHETQDWEPVKAMSDSVILHKIAALTLMRSFLEDGENIALEFVTNKQDAKTLFAAADAIFEFAELLGLEVKFKKD